MCPSHSMSQGRSVSQNVGTRCSNQALWFECIRCPIFDILNVKTNYNSAAVPAWYPTSKVCQGLETHIFFHQIFGFNLRRRTNNARNNSCLPSHWRRKWLAKKNPWHFEKWPSRKWIFPNDKTFTPNQKITKPLFFKIDIFEMPVCTPA